MSGAVSSDGVTDALEHQPRRAASIAAMSILHLHHRLEGAPGRRVIGIGDRGHERARCDLPGQAPPVLAPPAGALLSAIPHDHVPQAVGFSLVVGRNLERKGFAMPELGATIQSQTGNAHHGELDRQNVALFARGVVAGRAKDSSHGAVRERRGV